MYPELFRRFEELNIGYFFYIGGNDSMDTVSKLSRYAVYEQLYPLHGRAQDHRQRPGGDRPYPWIRKRRQVCGHHGPRDRHRRSVYDNKQSVTIVEIMGRHAGWLTAASMLARKFKGDNPVLIYLPEVAFDQEAFIGKVKEALKTTPNLVVCISEGINDGKGTFICEYASEVGTDTFGHKMLTALENIWRILSKSAWASKSAP